MFDLLLEEEIKCQQCAGLHVVQRIAVCLAVAHRL